MNQAVIITGHLGVVGYYCSHYLARNGYKIIGIDNDTRSTLFNLPRITGETREKKEKEIMVTESYDIDITSKKELERIFREIVGKYSVKGIIHCAAQPSHDWATKDIDTDHRINTVGTINICEVIRKYATESILIHLSTNKVYGDGPNYVGLKEYETRYDVGEESQYYEGIDEMFSVDHTKHSFFGCSKLAADLYVQEYKKYFDLNTVVLRGGCLTGGAHRGAKLHGFMNFLIKTAINDGTYEIIGYKGKQVRDNLHGEDIGRLVDIMIKNKNDVKKIEDTVYNIGGNRKNSISIIELVKMLDTDFGLRLKTEYNEDNRIGDHQWYISNTNKLKNDFNWEPKIGIKAIVEEIINKSK